MNSILERIYSSSPIWFQDVLTSVYGWKLRRVRYGNVYRKSLKEYLAKDYSDEKSENEYQLSELKRILNHASQNCSFYREFYRGINLNSINSVEDISILPILEKETLRQNINNIYTVKERNAKTSFTGGTTGKALKVLFTKDDAQKRMAYLDAFKIRAGIDTFKDRKATFSGKEFTNDKVSSKRKIFWRNNWLYNQRLYSTFDLKDENMSYYIENLNKYKPQVLNGFVSAYFELAMYIDRHNIELSFIPKAVFTTSETLMPHHRALIEKVFQTKVYNQYASGEGACFITECKNGNLHYNIDTGIIEKYTTEYGDEMLVTSFTSYGTPLIRYRIGDKIEFKNGKCLCKSCHPLVERIEGRKVEYLYSKEKGNISLSHLADVIKGMPNNIISMQFVQNDYEHIIIKLVIDEDKYNRVRDEKSIRSQMVYRFGSSTLVDIEYVAEIMREKSGKFALIKNNMA